MEMKTILTFFSSIFSIAVTEYKFVMGIGAPPITLDFNTTGKNVCELWGTLLFHLSGITGAMLYYNVERQFV